MMNAVCTPPEGKGAGTNVLWNSPEDGQEWGTVKVGEFVELSPLHIEEERRIYLVARVDVDRIQLISLNDGNRFASPLPTPLGGTIDIRRFFGGPSDVEYRFRRISRVDIIIDPEPAVNSPDG